MLNITYEDRTTNIWVKERTQVIPCHHLEETQLQERRRGRAAKWWRDDQNKYLRYTIWQRSVQYRLTWRRHAEAFAQPRYITAAQ